MPDLTPRAPAAPRAPRPPYRPPLGLPLQREGPWGKLASTLAHALLLLAIIMPLFQHDVALIVERGAGGAGPVGGGGGGRRGTGGDERKERLRFFAVAVPPAAPPATPPALQPPKPTPPKPPPPPVAPPLSLPVQEQAAAPAPVDVAPISGVGGGTGNDGTAGMGPGTGGGVGTGAGTGRGSANGPGTGGDGGTIYPATPEAMMLPPLPAPHGVRGKKVTVLFSLDESGKVLRVEFASTGDGSYDKELRRRCLEYRFRPAHRMDGTPVASVYPFGFDL